MLHGPRTPRILNATQKLRVQNSRMALPNRTLVRSVMATAPTITTGSSSSMSSPFFRPSASGNGALPLLSQISDCFTYTKGHPSTVTTGTGIQFDNVTTSNTPTYGASSFGVSFMHDGQIFELVFGANSTSYLVKIDDQYVTLTPQSVGSSGTFFAKYDCGSVKRRRVDVIGFNSAFDGVNIGANDSLEQAPIRGPRAIFLGDSFTNGTGASGGAANNFVQAFADAMGWDDVWSSGVASTGYLATASGTAPTFRGRVARDVIAYSPELVVIAGSVNDDSASPSAIGAEALLLYQQLTSSLPNAVIAAVYTASGGVNKMTANKLAVKAAMQASAIVEGVLWLDLTEMPLLAGATVPSGITLNVSNSGTAGSTGILVRNVPQPGATIQIDSERIQIKTMSQAGNDGAPYYRILFDGALQATHANGAAWTQVGGSLWTGIGFVGATTGYGNCDLRVFTDGIHPTTVGHTAIGDAGAMLLINTLPPN